MKGKLSEKETAGASYIINFYKEVQTLKVFYAQYENVMLELENTYPTIEAMKKAPDEVVAQIKAAVQAVRQTVNLVHISYKSILASTKIKADKDIDKYYEETKRFIIDRKSLYEYVTKLNTFLLNDVISSLLETSQHLVDSLYENGDTGSETS